MVPRRRRQSMIKRALDLQGTRDMLNIGVAKCCRMMYPLHEKNRFLSLLIYRVYLFVLELYLLCGIRIQYCTKTWVKLSEIQFIFHGNLSFDLINSVSWEERQEVIKITSNRFQTIIH